MFTVPRLLPSSSHQIPRLPISLLKKPPTKRIASSMESRRPAITDFPYLPPSSRDMMVEILSDVNAQLGPQLLPSELPPDVLSFQNSQGTSLGALDIRSGVPGSMVDCILESWFHCKLPTGSLNITTIFAVLNALTDAPHLLMELIQSSPTSFILLMDLLPRKDAVLYPDYLEEFYQNTNLDKLRQDLEQVPQVQPYRFPSLYIRSVFSPVAVTVSINCGTEGESCIDEINQRYIRQAAKEVVRVWMERCVNRTKDLTEQERAVLVVRDGLIKSKTVEIDLTANLPRLFGSDVACRVVGEIQKAFKIKG